MEVKTVSTEGLDFIASEEGLVLHPYRDSVGIPTIGIGCTYYEDGSRVKMTDPPITKERAYSLFRHILDHFERTVWSVTRDDINQHQFDALVSLCYNIGTVGFKSSTVLKRVNENPEDPKIADAFKMWRNAGGQKGILLARRKREVELYFKKC